MSSIFLEIHTILLKRRLARYKKHSAVGLLNQKARFFQIAYSHAIDMKDSGE
ncbi:hypothetical protein MKY82_05620 [Paenibacillus sp. FSL W7-1279]|uniref:hypothetical protein n=1 Tax=Paenibacillus TaxID=44249 RepID=UPI001C7D5FDF|nr:hypothetical protein [Paenibacillus lautus]MBX4150669.1 hypothetical protein [Paenibacillus lautus]